MSSYNVFYILLAYYFLPFSPKHTYKQVQEIFIYFSLYYVYIVKNSIFLNFQRNKPATISNTFSGAILQSKNVCCLG
ncbi:hypothetical protein DW780_06610 [Bacteroides thetaiotaomicron]|uniref:Uncharacterized protein n=1 Tax=Bacteroides thetaiotaomicron TaxID=818 RepID=A0A414HR40_BACT4|nr:hypothetical protein DW780_06610 [Bacteroides thetaiotaomicron]